MFDSLEIIKENSHEDASLRLQELIGKFIQDNEKFSLNDLSNLWEVECSL